VSAYIETLKFKVSLAAGDNVEEEVNLILHSHEEKEFLKITPLKVMYIHLRDNCLFPQRKNQLFTQFTIVQCKLLRKLIERIYGKLEEALSSQEAAV
jgi:hypothetical protein